MNGVMERKISVIKEGSLEMLINGKLNKDSQKMMWARDFHMCENIINSMANTCSTTSQFEKFYGEKPKIVDSFPEFGHIRFVTK